MPVCFNCNGEFKNESSLISHISLNHKFLPNFSCAEPHCARSFHLFDSFRKHRNKIHCNDIKLNFPVSTSHTQNNSTSVLFNVENNIVETPLNEHPLPTFSTPLTPKPIDTPKPIELPSVSSQVHFIAKLHSYADLPRSRVVNIVQDVDTLINEQLESLQTEVLSSIAKKLNNDQLISEIENVFQKQKDQFSKLKTEHVQLKEFSRLGTYIEPIQCPLGLRDDFRKSGSRRSFVHLKSAAEFIPIRKVLKAFFEQPKIFDETISYYNSLISEKNIIENFVQGSIWRKKILNFENKTVFPLFLFFDDYENNNPLGSHAGIQKCGAVYISIPCLPPSLNSKLNSIFLFILVNSLDHKLFKNEKVFKRAIEELIYLETVGIELNLIDKNNVIEKKKIFFSLSLVLGDNLGLHAILGFTESFRSTYCCRICCLGSNDFDKNFVEEASMLRNRTNYNEQVLINDVKKTGITEKCVFNVLPTFHVTENVAVDPMHDILEGICQYDLALILHNIVFVEKYFTLTGLNARIRGFDYARWDNKCPEILDTHLKNFKLKMSSAEIKALVKYLGLIIGDLVPTDCSSWKLYTLMKKIIDLIIFCQAFDPNVTDYLTVLISDYLKCLVEHFPNCIKPKHHFLTHYPKMMLRNGPLWKCSSMRFESKHRQGKITSRSAICKINVCRTISIKHQLILNYNFISNNFIRNNVWETAPYSKDEVLDANILNVLPANLKFNFRTVDWAKFHDKIISTNTIFVGLNDETGETCFWKVEKILVNISGISFITSVLKEVFRDEHFQAYKMYNEGNPSFVVINQTEILEKDLDIASCHLIGNGNWYIAVSWA